MKISIASDHAGFDLKESVKKILESLNVPYEDLGPDGTDSVDYPDYAVKVAKSVQKGNRGILICGTGIGMSITANRFRGVRAALCTDPYMAEMSRKHNNSNLLALGGRTQEDPETVSEIVKTWLDTEFEGGRHQRRLDKIDQIQTG